MKFKVGDKVSVVNGNDSYFKDRNFNPTGMSGIIVFCGHEVPFNIIVDIKMPNGDDCAFCEQELELEEIYNSTLYQLMQEK